MKVSEVDLRVGSPSEDTRSRLRKDRKSTIPPVGLVIMLILLLLYFLNAIPSDEVSRYNPHENVGGPSQISKFEIPKEKAFRNIEKIVDPLQTLEQVCQETYWQENIYLNCTQIAGGTFNVRNSIMTCIRWAIDGGMGMIFPKIGERSKEAPNKWFDAYGDLTYLFDVPHLKKSLNQKCPKLILIENDSELQSAENKITTKFTEWRPYIKTTYGRRVEEYILQQVQNETYKEQGKTVFIEGNPLWGWHFYREPNIRNEILDAVSFNTKLLDLAKAIQANLKGNFIGLHLRVEIDAGWHTFDEVTSWFKNMTEQNNQVGVDIYLATGTYQLEQNFRKLFPKTNVISKWTLAESDKKLTEELNDLRFDQMAVIDFELLKLSHHFYGLAQSSLAYAVALERSKLRTQSSMSNLLDIADPYFVCCI